MAGGKALLLLLPTHLSSRPWLSTPFAAPAAPPAPAAPRSSARPPGAGVSSRGTEYSPPEAPPPLNIPLPSPSPAPAPVVPCSLSAALKENIFNILPRYGLVPSPPPENSPVPRPSRPPQLPDSREVENRLVGLLDFERFELIKELLRNQGRIVWCMRLARAQVSGRAGRPWRRRCCCSVGPALLAPPLPPRAPVRLGVGGMSGVGGVGVRSVGGGGSTAVLQWHCKLPPAIMLYCY